MDWPQSRENQRPAHNTNWEERQDGAPHRHKDAQNSGIPRRISTSARWSRTAVRRRAQPSTGHGSNGDDSDPAYERFRFRSATTAAAPSASAAGHAASGTDFSSVYVKASDNVSEPVVELTVTSTLPEPGGDVT